RSTATFTGSGFAPNEVVVLKVKNLSYPCNTVFADSSYLPWTATADADGNFVTTWTVCNCPGDSLRLKATGQTSGLIAYAYFTDGANDPFYTATIDPVVGTIGVSGTYSITISNLTSNPGNPSFIGVIGSLRIAIPVGAGTPTGISITANDPGPIDRSANWALTLQTSTLLEFENAAAGSGAAANDIDPGGTIVITFTTTATTVGSKEWTTTTYRVNNFNNIGAISGSQPTVTICNPPTIGGQGANATINCPATPTFTTPTASSTCRGTTINLVSDITTAGTCTGTYSETRSWDATDVNGAHSSTVSQTITVIDNTPPTIGSPGAGTTIDCPATPTFTPPTASDACNSASVVQVSDVTTAGTCTGTYSETRTWKAVDNCGNQSGTVSQTITVRDNTPPTIGSPGAAATIDCPATPTFTAPTANDACSSASVVLVSDISAAGTCTGTYTRTQTWKAVDACGNQSGTVAQTITVRDNTPPTIGSPGAAATIDCPATPTFTAPTANDACSSASVVLVSDISAAGTCTGTYTRTQTWKAVDACGNQSGTVAQTITVRDNTPPTIGSPGAAATIDCPATPTFTAPTANDACSSASVVLVSDISAAGTCTGTYTRTQTWKAVDACGNQSGTVAQTI